MRGNSPDGDRRNPAPEARKRQGAGAGKFGRPVLSHRHVMAAILGAGVLVPLSQPAEAGWGDDRSVEIRNDAVALASFDAVPAAAPELVAPSSDRIDPMAEVAKLKHAQAVKAKREREEAAAAKRAKAKAAAAAKAAAKRAAKPDFVRPAKGRFTSGFGARWGTSHNGIDIANAIGTPIVSVADGTVVEAGPASGFGLWVQVRHSDGTITVYGHMNEITTAVGQRVKAGEKIATIGNRGQSTGPHLHFEVWQGGGTKVDPLGWLAAKGVRV